MKVFSNSYNKVNWKNIPVNSLSKSFALSNLHTIYALRQGEPNAKRNLDNNYSFKLHLIIST